MKTIDQDISNDTNLKVEENSKSSKLNQDREWIDDAFCVEKGFVLWKSVRKDTGEDFLFGMTKEAVIEMTRFHLKCEQENTLHLYTRVVGMDGIY
jgi:hypothetical protein